MSNSSIQFQTSLNKAMRGDPIEQYMVGHFYKNGIGVSVDNGKAKEFSDLALAKLKEIQKLAEKGNAQAQFVWGNVHASGQGVRQNDKTAAIWYKKAAKQGNPEAQYYLGFMYQKGLGVKKNIDEAVNWYRIAAERGNASGQCNLGHMYEKGLEKLRNKTIKPQYSQRQPPRLKRLSSYNPHE